MDRRLIVLATGMFALGTDSFVIAGIMPVISKSLNLPIALIGQMVTLYAISYALLAPVMAAVTAHWPRKRLLLTALSVFILGNLMTGLASSLTMLLASRVIAGLGAAMYSPTATSTGAMLVPPEKRGTALAVVIAGLSIATALGSPIGTLLSSFGEWRLTMWFVSVLGVAAFVGIALLMPQVPPPPAVSLRQRLAPLADSRVAWALATTVFTFTGLFMVYTYLGVAFDRVTHGNGSVLAGLLLIWGAAATVGNIAGGRLTDKFGSRHIIFGTIIVALVNFLLLPWSSANIVTAALALIVWGIAGWGMFVPQQHRMLSIAPALGPLLLGLNQASLQLGVSLSGVLGGIGVTYLDKYHLGWFGAVFLVAAAFSAELAHRRISAHSKSAAAQAA